MITNRHLLTLATALLLACAMLFFTACGSPADDEIDEEVVDGEVVGEEVVVGEVVPEELAVTLGVDGVTIIDLYEEPSEEQRRFAVAVNTNIPGEDIDVLEPGTVTYDIYDLAEGVPTKETEPMQNIHVEEYMCYDKAPCDVDDYNFDGAKDFSLWVLAGAQNAQGKFFLWDESEGQFVENEALGQLISPMIRENDQLIMEYIHVSGSEYIVTFYRWVEEELIPVRQIVQWPADINVLQGEVYDWDEDDWSLIFERKILLSEGEWTQEDYDKMDDLGKELGRYYDPQFYGL